MDTLPLQVGASAAVSTPETIDTARAILQILREVGNLKRLRRSGWEIKNIPNPESVAEHSFRLTIIAFFAPAHLDRNRLRDMALVHDLGEVIAGDYTPHDKVPKETKHEQEELFFHYAKSIIPDHPAAQYWMELWQEYEGRKTPEALWLYDADKMESVIQSREYTERGHTNLEEFLGLIPRFTTPQMMTWGKVLQEEIRQDQLRREHIPIIFVTGLPSIDKATYSKLLCEELNAKYLSLSEILTKRSANAVDPRAKFAALYLQKGLETSPIEYMTDLLKENIDIGISQGKRCVIIDGFPRNVKQLRGFEEKVQEGNLVVLLSSEKSIRQDDASAYAIRSFRELEDHQREKLFKKIDIDVSEQDVYTLLKKATEAFIEHINSIQVSRNSC